MQRLLESLTADGLAVPYTKTIKTTRIRLTPTGDERAPLAWLPTVGDALEVVRSVLEHELARNVCMRHTHGGPWTPEVLLIGKPWGAPDCGREIAGVQDRALPALVRGWLLWETTALRHGYMRTTKAGRAALEDPPEAGDNLPRGSAKTGRPLRQGDSRRARFTRHDDPAIVARSRDTASEWTACPGMRRRARGTTTQNDHARNLTPCPKTSPS